MALDARLFVHLFRRKITENGVSIFKQPHIKLSSSFLSCEASKTAFFEAAAQRARAAFSAEDTKKKEKD